MPSYRRTWTTTYDQPPNSSEKEAAVYWVRNLRFSAFNRIYRQPRSIISMYTHTYAPQAHRKLVFIFTRTPESLNFNEQNERILHTVIYIRARITFPSKSAQHIATRALVFSQTAWQRYIVKARRFWLNPAPKCASAAAASWQLVYLILILRALYCGAKLINRELMRACIFARFPVLYRRKKKFCTCTRALAIFGCREIWVT